jgi:hypothetical protein
MAAVHAGVLRAGQYGRVQVEILPGQGNYFGSERNGVYSGNYSWGGIEHSGYRFVSPTR